MARYKVLKSVAHNIGHSFTSLMNYAGDDYGNVARERTLKVLRVRTKWALWLA